MAVKLVKAIKREMLSKPQSGKDRNKSIIVSLDPGDTISFRAKGCKKSISVSLASCYSLAVIMDIKNTYAEKVKQYKLKKDAGRKAKRPKVPYIPYNKILLQVI